MQNKFIYAILLSALQIISIADTLSIETAVAIGLEKNYGIILLKNDVEHSLNQEKLKVGYLLPQISASGGYTYSVNDNKTTTALTSTGITQKNTLTAGIFLSWTLFDGFRMFYARNIIDANVDLATTLSQRGIEDCVASIMIALYRLNSYQTLYDIAREKLELSKELFLRLETKHTIGGVTRRELLRQNILLNSDSSTLAERKFLLELSRYNFNLLLGRNPQKEVAVVVDNSVTNINTDPEKWIMLAGKNSSTLSVSEMNMRMAKLKRKIAVATFWPMIVGSGSYGVSRIENADLANWSAGVSVTVPILGGFQRITNKQNATLDADAAKLSYEEEKRKISALVYEQCLILDNSYESITFEEQSVDLAKQNLEITHDLFEAGSVNGLVFREAQIELASAKARLESNKYKVFLTTIELKRICGTLLVNPSLP